ncbi:ATP-binding cassette domain-containing protein [Catenovulum sp. SM1970]|uniref:oligopeptide/dipeptide ABC transporter ATP-binding protein n=1 Tax=Marinifaba aquimaris TaxID=2741323 RepID=UPI001572729D|nr:oligopeptide/dipeptide ABC transporter ATP-binding protein [Marinifaba aquimaris]NTS77811.1 ATP-binding cassette domain-containing protein [Marinifaba aquimaris]
MPLLDIRNLTVSLENEYRTINAIDKMSLTLRNGSIHGLVGESGSGKTLVAKAIMGLLDGEWSVKADRLFWQDQDLLRMSDEQRQAIIHRDIAMIFQEPSRSLDPTAPIIEQIEEVIPSSELPNSFWGRRQARHKHAEGLLKKVGIKSYQRCLSSYPHELSEGLCQKVMIAMAIARNPKLLIADEPTDAMESTTKVQIMRLLQKLNESKDMSILLISHDLNAIANWSDDISILYAGQSVESGTKKAILKRPLHPYTQILFQNIKKFSEPGAHKSPLFALEGTTPPVQHLPIGCRLGPRCPKAQKQCVKTPKAKKLHGHIYHCHFPVNMERKGNE